MNSTAWPKKSLVALSLAAALMFSACGAETSPSDSTTSGNDVASASGEVSGDAGAPPAGDGEAGAPPAAAAGADSAGASPDLTDAAKTLGVSVTKLESALGGPPPDFEAAAKTLGLSVDELMAALPSDANPSQGS